MALLWDYDEKKIKKTAWGRKLILERQINYGHLKKGEKIKLSEVKRLWDKLELYPNARKLMSLLIWGKYRSSRASKKKSFLL